MEKELARLEVESDQPTTRKIMRKILLSIMHKGTGGEPLTTHTLATVITPQGYEKINVKPLSDDARQKEITMNSYHCRNPLFRNESRTKTPASYD